MDFIYDGRPVTEAAKPLVTALNGLSGALDGMGKTLAAYETKIKDAALAAGLDLDSIDPNDPLVAVLDPGIVRVMQELTYFKGRVELARKGQK